MAEIGKSVERWRSLVQEELSISGIPLPDDLVLALIWTESRGHPGSTNEKSGASGLMQVMPNTLSWYNQQTGNNIPLSTLRSTAKPREQIRVGIWVLGQFWRSAYRYLRDRLNEVPTDELGKIADLFYVAGPGATKHKLDKLQIPFYKYVAQRWPEWNALPHVLNVWSHLPDTVAWDLAELSKWLESSVVLSKKAKNGAIAAIAAVILGYWWFIRRKNAKKEENE